MIYRKTIILILIIMAAKLATLEAHASSNDIDLDQCLDIENMEKSDNKHAIKIYRDMMHINYGIFKSHNLSKKDSPHYNRIDPERLSFIKNILEKYSRKSATDMLIHQIKCSESLDNEYTYYVKSGSILINILNFYDYSILKNKEINLIFEKYGPVDFIQPNGRGTNYINIYYRALLNEGIVNDHRLMNAKNVDFHPDPEQLENSKIFSTLGEITLITSKNSPYDIDLKRDITGSIDILFKNGMEVAYNRLIKQFSWCAQKPSPCGVSEYEGMLVAISFFHKKPYSDKFIKYLQSEGPLSEEIVKQNDFFNFFSDFDPYLRFGFGNVSGKIRSLDSYHESVLYDPHSKHYHLRDDKYGHAHYNPYIRRVLAYQNYAQDKGLIE